MAKALTRISHRSKLEKAVKSLVSKQVLVGIPAGPKRNDAGMTNAVLGYILSTGSPLNNLPPRPFLAPGIKTIEDKVSAEFKRAGLKAFHGDYAGAEQVFDRVGLIAVSAVRKYILDRIEPPLAPSTVYKRMHRTSRRRTDPNPVPLIDSGELLDTITYVTRK